MDLVDQPNRQAEKHSGEQDAVEQAQAHMRARVHEALRAVSGYFTEFANSLKVAEPHVPRKFAVQGNVCLRTLVQGDYLVSARSETINGRDYLAQVTLRFHAAGEEVLTLESYADHSTDRMRNYLQAYGLRFETQAFRNERGVALKTAVSVLPDIPATITATADWTSGTIRLKLRNVEAIGDAEYCYDPVEVGHKLLDELAKLILGQANDFCSMGRHQKSLHMRIVSRPAEIPPAREAQAEPAPQPESRPGLFGSFKSLWKR